MKENMRINGMIQYVFGEEYVIAELYQLSLRLI